MKSEERKEKGSTGDGSMCSRREHIEYRMKQRMKAARKTDKNALLIAAGFHFDRTDDSELRADKAG